MITGSVKKKKESPLVNGNQKESVTQNLHLVQGTVCEALSVGDVHLWLKRVKQSRTECAIQITCIRLKQY